MCNAVAPRAGSICVLVCEGLVLSYRATCITSPTNRSQALLLSLPSTMILSVSLVKPLGKGRMMRCICIAETDWQRSNAFGAGVYSSPTFLP
ncbi:hypothetical protein BCV69DRAFT_62083 [Microstroma glucosiphilum]|uniref:Uncharacterized protein n=1 Tax=Pseudomicrostroma glucosiphilum TaxID=1684307 RepID=A0A316U010_9BASI|nr:hypothetical protein BCV69DRAFT_62083 [Pseudomicrostroma glucosiphilum]PWN18756.1 hypothetical protein BCV69DRAFT_62083 [Pseudomicrostroma glucosiphilum]